MKDLYYFQQLYGKSILALHKWLKSKAGEEPTPTTSNFLTLTGKEIRTADNLIFNVKE